MRVKRGKSAQSPEQDPNASTLSFDAFTPAVPPAPYAAGYAGPAGSGAPDGSASGPADPDYGSGYGEGSGSGYGSAFNADPGSPSGSEPPYFAYPPSDDSADLDPTDPTDPTVPPPANQHRTRSLVIIAGALLLVCAVTAGIYAAMSSPPDAQSTQSATAAGAPAPGVTSAAHRGRGKVETARVTITAVNGDTLTGTTASGVSITIDLTSDTRLGTKARPLTPGQLAAGDVVIVRGQRTDAGTYTALDVIAAPSSGDGSTSTSTSTGQSL